MITSTGNGRIRELAKLKKSAKDRNEKGIFLVEGPKMFREIPFSLLREAYASESFLKTADGRLAMTQAEQAGIRMETVSDSVFQYVSDTRSPQGILAVVEQLRYSVDELKQSRMPADAEADMRAASETKLLTAAGPKTAAKAEAHGKQPLVIVLENLQDPGNLGTILRTAEAAGATGILLSKDCADIYNPKVTRSTMGSIFRVPFVYTDHLQEELLNLKKAGVRLYAAHLKGSTDMYAETYTGASAFLIGNESRGLAEDTAALADQAVRIPMSGKVESLNAAVAASVLLYEAKRQRDLQLMPVNE